MEATSFDESNHSLGPPPGVSEDECSSLAVFVDGKHVVSCWKLTREELEEVNRTGRVWLTIWGRTMPPACVQVASPFKQQQEAT